MWTAAPLLYVGIIDRGGAIVKEKSAPGKIFISFAKRMAWRGLFLVKSQNLPLLLAMEGSGCYNIWDEQRRSWDGSLPAKRGALMDAFFAGRNGSGRVPGRFLEKERLPTGGQPGAAYSAARKPAGRI